jgi:two-component system, NtrC family, response regulator AtoC
LIEGSVVSLRAEERSESKGPPRLCVLVMGKQLQTHWLPDTGTVILGSGADCDVRIPDPSVAPQHVRLTLGNALQLEDLGTGRVTKIREVLVVPKTPTPLAPGELVMIGSVLIIIQRRTSEALRRIWTHGYFEARLEEACISSERFHTRFALLRIHCDGQPAQELIEDVLANALRMVDIVGCYGPGEYEILLSDTQPDSAQIVTGRIVERFEQKGMRSRIGMACFPRDGRSADELMARATAAAVGEEGRPSDQGELAGLGGTMRDLHKLVERIASSTINVLILGETGVGKEGLAEMVHRLSPRGKKPFLRLNCAALSETLLESELFGHARGAFTGAVQAKPGLLETADGGTIFLDEIGELPLSMQVKLLRVIEERRVLPVGAVTARSIDVRFVMATNRDLEAEVERGAFRQDLYYRVNGVSLYIPPLRERLSEIVNLARTFIADVCEKNGRSPPSIAPDAIELLQRYSWPGNIRELRNVIERAVLLCSSGPITLEHLSVEKMSASFAPRHANSGGGNRSANSESPPMTAPALSGASRGPREVEPVETPPKAPVAAIPAQPPPQEKAAPTEDPQGSLRNNVRNQVESYERDQIMKALSSCNGNQTAAAKLLGISRRTLISRLDDYGISGPRKRRNV